jgi:hypothetical protein
VVGEEVTDFLSHTPDCGVDPRVVADRAINNIVRRFVQEDVCRPRRIAQLRRADSDKPSLLFPADLELGERTLRRLI